MCCEVEHSGLLLWSRARVYAVVDCFDFKKLYGDLDEFSSDNRSEIRLINYYYIGLLYNCNTRKHSVESIANMCRILVNPDLSDEQHKMIVDAFTSTKKWIRGSDCTGLNLLFPGFSQNR